MWYSAWSNLSIGALRWSTTRAALAIHLADSASPIVPTDRLPVCLTVRLTKASSNNGTLQLFGFSFSSLLCGLLLKYTYVREKVILQLIHFVFWLIAIHLLLPSGRSRFKRTHTNIAPDWCNLWRNVINLNSEWGRRSPAWPAEIERPESNRSSRGLAVDWI